MLGCFAREWFPLGLCSHRAIREHFHLLCTLTGAVTSASRTWETRFLADDSRVRRLDDAPTAFPFIIFLERGTVADSDVLPVRTVLLEDGLFSWRRAWSLQPAVVWPAVVSSSRTGRAECKKGTVENRTAAGQAGPTAAPTAGQAGPTAAPTGSTAGARPDRFRPSDRTHLGHQRRVEQSRWLAERRP